MLGDAIVGLRRCRGARASARRQEPYCSSRAHPAAAYTVAAAASPWSFARRAPRGRRRTTRGGGPPSAPLQRSCCPGEQGAARASDRRGRRSAPSRLLHRQPLHRLARIDGLGAPTGRRREVPPRYGNGYPKPEIQWVFTPLGHMRGSIYTRGFTNGQKVRPSEFVGRGHGSGNIKLEPMNPWFF
jgi:hypothetical protein